MGEIKILYIEGRNGRMTYGIERGTSSDEEYKNFLKEKKLIDIDGKTCYSLTDPKN